MSDCHSSGPVSRTGLLLPAHHSVAIVGPPNSGKSTLFNRLTGLRQKVANYPGVTVEHKSGKMQISRDREVDLIDLPGVYSLEPRSEDERVTKDVLTGDMPGVRRPGAILLILDSTNLGRHLMLAAPVLALGLPTLVLLNMADDLEDRGGSIDTAAIAQKLGAPVALISAARGEGIEPVSEFLNGALAVPTPRVELPVLNQVPACRAWAAKISENAYNAPAPPIWTKRLDSIFLHPILGLVIFAVVVVAVFQTIFAGAAPLMDGVDWLVSTSGDALKSAMPPSIWRDVLIEGVWGGVGSLLVFLPQILILFLFIGILEDSGYLARAAVITDRTMNRAGLQGKSFIPLLSSYACAVPAIMATRTIENKRDRIATILIAPFMTCSARLPLYGMVIAMLIPPDRHLIGGFVTMRTGAMLGLYALGFAAAFLTALALKSSILRGERTPFVMEMPAYRWPTLQSLGLRLLDRAKVFLKKAGTVILATALGLWVLAHVPLQDGKPPAIQDSVAGVIGRTVEPVIKPLGFNWKIGIGLITSLAAREVIVATLGTIYGIDEDQDGEHPRLQEALQRDLKPGGAVALLIFFAFAMQCMSTVAVVRRETGGWKWPIVQFSYMTGMAYICAYIANKVVTAWLA